MLFAAYGMKALRCRCPHSLLLTRAGSGVAAVADVMDVSIVPGFAGNDTVELLLRVVDNPSIVPEHDSKHPVQVNCILLHVHVC
jgi:hypothetical protein